MSYLITMGSRPGDTILDPFAGSGTTGYAALLEIPMAQMIRKAIFEYMRTEEENG